MNNDLEEVIASHPCADFLRQWIKENPGKLPGFSSTEIIGYMDENHNIITFDNPVPMVIEAVNDE